MPTRKELENSLEGLAVELGKVGGCAVSTGSCMVAGTAVHIALGQTIAMGPQWSAGSVRVLGRVESRAEEMPLQAGPPTDHAQRRVVYLIANPGQDNEVFLSLLRWVEWLAEHQAEVGRRIHLDLHEMGIHGPAGKLQTGEALLTSFGAWHSGMLSLSSLPRPRSVL